MEKTNSFVSSSGDQQKSPEKHLKPRIPPEISGLQYNFCKNLTCSQFGLISDNQPKEKNKKKPYRFVSGGKNYPLLKCNECGESPPLKSNHGIISEINRISKYLKLDKNISCSNKSCENQSVPLGAKKAYRSFGKTKAGASRYQCKKCFKTFSIPLPTQYQHDTHHNIMIFKMLVNKVPLARIVNMLEISWEVLYHRINFIHKQCLAFVANRERKLKKLPIERLHLAVDRQDYVVNWTERKDKRNVILSSIASADNKTGYVFGIHPNFDATVNREEIEAHAKLCGDHKFPPLHRVYPQYWLEADYRESLKRKQTKLKGNNLTESIKITYKEASKRDDDVEVFDRKDSDEKLPDYGMQIHAEYTLIAHFYFLKKLLGNVDKWRFFLDQESGIRGAFISAFQEEIVNHDAEAFYIKIAKNYTVDQKRSYVAEVQKELDLYSKEFPELTKDQLKLKLLKSAIAESQEIGQWQDRWVKHPIPSMSEPNKSMCWLTSHAEFDEDHIAWLYNMVSLHGVDTFFEKIRRRIYMLERPLHSSSNDGRTWSGYAAYDPNNVIKMVEIFRVVHNYIDTRKKEGKKTTPAMRLGLSQAPMKYEDILYFRE